MIITRENVIATITRINPMFVAMPPGQACDEESGMGDDYWDGEEGDCETIQHYQGQTFQGTLYLRQRDQGSRLVKPYAIPVGATVEIHFPGTSATVILSTANAGEVTLNANSETGRIDYVGSPTKAALLALVTNGDIDVLVKDTSNNSFPFVKAGKLSIAALANP